MDGVTPAGPDFVIDHDRLFKELLTTFFVEFLQLFFPKLAALIDPESVVFLEQEHFVNFPDGAEYLADIVAKVRYRGDPAYFLIHVEHQSTTPATFPRRFFRYFSAIHEKHDVPVYPIVIYSHDAPKKAQPHTYRIDFPDGRVLRFDYRVVQLNRLSWRKFLDRSNPMASALMAKMKVSERDRPKVKAECLRLMVTLKLDRARMRMIAAFVDTYLRLNAEEEGRFQKSLSETEWMPRQKEEVMEIVTSWEQRGIDKGIVLGRKEGELNGLLNGLRTSLLDLLTWKFGPLQDAVHAKVSAIASVDQLRALTHQAFSAASLDELGLASDPS
jgi:hypothetical protein